MSRMGRVLLRRLPWLAFVIIGIITLTFVVTNIIPADPARAAAGMQATESQVEEMRRRMGLDKPLTVQYANYLQRLIHGDFGTVPATGRPVLEDLKHHFPATLELVLAAIIPTTVFGIVLGITAAAHGAGPIDKGIQTFCIIGTAMPHFWFGIVLQILLFGWLGLFPTIGRLSLGVTPPPDITGLYLVDSLITGQVHVFLDALWHIILPATALLITSLANIARVTRASMFETLASDYVRTARAKGLSQLVVVYRHALRNAWIPILTMIGLQMGFLFSAAIVVEVVFAWPGIGKYAVDSIISLYFPPIMGVTLLIAGVFVLVNLIVDMLYTVVDPRIQA